MASLPAQLPRHPSAVPGIVLPSFLPLTPQPLPPNDSHHLLFFFILCVPFPQPKVQISLPSMSNMDIFGMQGQGEPTFPSKCAHRIGHIGPTPAAPAEFSSFQVCPPLQLPIPSSFSSFPGTAEITKPHTVTQTPRKQVSVGRVGSSTEHPRQALLHLSLRMKAAGIFPLNPVPGLERAACVGSAGDEEPEGSSHPQCHQPQGSGTTQE